MEGDEHKRWIFIVCVSIDKQKVSIDEELRDETS